ncbi:MAG: DUF3604 domain-containing protein [Pseudomonadota bacterium]
MLVFRFLASSLLLALAACGADTGSLSDISSNESSTLSGADRINRMLEPEADLLERQVFRSPRPGDTANPERNAYFGDLHVHTSYSFDAYTFGTVTTPRDAYRYAQGEAILHPSGYEIQLDRPLDFYAVTDHAMFFGVAKEAADARSELGGLPVSHSMNGMNAPDNYGLLSLLPRAQAFGTFSGELVQQIRAGQVDQQMVMDITRRAWADTVDAADEAYDPGRFTTFAAYEYTSSTWTRGNLHRNVIFRGTDKLPAVPFSRLNSRNPEGLWDWMDGLRRNGIESLAIPHNANGSDGQMFALADWAGDPLDDDYGEQRMRNEPLVEITQIKGTSDTHPGLSPNDEWANFELMEYRVATKLASSPQGSYVREALRNGLALDARGVTNPFKFGLVAATDTHVAGGAEREDRFFSKAGLLDGEPDRRGSVPANWLIGTLARWVMPDIVKEVDGRTYMASSTFEYWGASGLAGVWAEQNTREAIYAAFRRKETFATSGPRIKLRFFAGLDFQEGLLDDPAAVRKAYVGGVAMGAELRAEAGRRPGFLVWAVADAYSAPLQRLQVVKGWEKDGETFERVFDVACSDGGKVDAETYRCPDNGAWVSAEDCGLSPGHGALELKALWQDPQFDESVDAFYYLRALENPSCRWSTWDALREGVEPRSDLPRTIQERAWSSPIWIRALESGTGFTSTDVSRDSAQAFHPSTP